MIKKNTLIITTEIEVIKKNISDFMIDSIYSILPLSNVNILIFIKISKMF
jgi:hypothetical protein